MLLGAFYAAFHAAGRQHAAGSSGRQDRRPRCCVGALKLLKSTMLTQHYRCVLCRPTRSGWRQQPPTSPPAPRRRILRKPPWRSAGRSWRTRKRRSHRGSRKQILAGRRLRRLVPARQPQARRRKARRRKARRQAARRSRRQESSAAATQRRRRRIHASRPMRTQTRATRCALGLWPGVRV